jgi:uncharacterized protein YbjT (DUF2867 family)
MRVIITGGTGLIGRALTRSLTNDGHEVIVLTRNPRPNSQSQPNVHQVKWDAATANELLTGDGVRSASNPFT